MFRVDRRWTNEETQTILTSENCHHCIGKASVVSGLAKTLGIYYRTKKALKINNFQGF